jgi:hypothetical protein
MHELNNFSLCVWKKKKKKRILFRVFGFLIWHYGIINVYLVWHSEVCVFMWAFFLFCCYIWFNKYIFLIIITICHRRCLKSKSIFRNKNRIINVFSYSFFSSRRLCNFDVFTFSVQLLCCFFFFIFIQTPFDTDIYVCVCVCARIARKQNLNLLI